jgi:diadenylate cyclase
LFAPLGHELLSGFWLAQLVDILIIAAIVRVIVTQLWKTPAMTVIAVFAFVLLLGIFLRQLQLFTVGYLIERLTSVLFIAVVVIFHQEIRSMLANFGRYMSRAFGGAAWTEHSTIQSLVEACGLMRKKEVGGLFVLERSENPERMYSDAIRLGRLDVTPELLVSIFTPPGPLHDGAVIIRNDSIVMASAFLPLSGRTYFRPRLGSRHRAALGITERSDAVAVVVSEETGLFRIASEGELEGPLSSDRLTERLLELAGH